MVGGSIEALTNRGLIADSFGGFQNGNYLNFTVPADTCYPSHLDAEPLMNAVYINGSTIELEKILLVQSTDTNSNVYEHNGLYYRSNFSTVLTEDKIQQVNNYLDTVVIPGKAESILRENNRRKKCSDSQQTLLRSGILPVEFEYFIKTQHTKSQNLRSKFEVQVVSGISYQSIATIAVEDGFSSSYSGNVTLKYEYIDENGMSVNHEEVINGDVTVIKRTSTGQYEYSYSNFPILQNSNGTFSNPPGIPSDVTYPFNLGSSLVFQPGTFISDSNTLRPLFYVIDGTAIASPWAPTLDLANSRSSFDVNYLPNGTSSLSVNNLKRSHPQFLLEYVKQSLPIEFEQNSNGEQVPVTPSKNWLSSAMIDKEIIRIIPLNFIGIDNQNYGMFPFATVDNNGTNLIGKLRIYGFAEFQYNAATASFSLVKWVELVEGGKATIKFDDEFVFDYEDDPTGITITSNGESKVHKLTPKEFDYVPGWSIRNCVCISNKVLWSDVKAAAKIQKNNISDSPPDGYELTDEERLYAEVRKAIK